MTLAKHARVFHRDGYACVYCLANHGVLTVDHVIPHARGGSNGYSNLVTACMACNTSKKSRSLNAWLQARSRWSAAQKRAVAERVAAALARPVTPLTPKGWRSIGSGRVERVRPFHVLRLAAAS